MSTDLKRRNVPFSPPDMTEAEAKDTDSVVCLGGSGAGGAVLRMV